MSMETNNQIGNVFLKVKVGDIVICYDDAMHDYVEHRMLVNSIENDREYATDTNLVGRVLYGEDLDDEDDETMICTVFENNFVRVYDSLNSDANVFSF